MERVSSNPMVSTDRTPQSEKQERVIDISDLSRD
jgi:hypothetical protein